MRKRFRKIPPNQQRIDSFFQVFPQKANLTCEIHKNKREESDHEISIFAEEERSSSIIPTDFILENNQNGKNLDSLKENLEIESEISQPSSPKVEKIINENESQIMIPVWKSENQIEKKENDDEKDDDHLSLIFYDFSTLCNIHYQLEIIERRINFGDDDVHQHPAMSVQILQDEGLYDITEEERSLRKQYKFKPFNKIKPDFWEPRCYDDEYARLTPKDNQHLQEAIFHSSDYSDHRRRHSRRVINWHPKDDLILSEKDQSCIIRFPRSGKNVKGAPLVLSIGRFSFQPLILSLSHDPQVSFPDFFMDNEQDIPYQPKPKSAPKKIKSKDKKHKKSHEKKTKIEKKLLSTDNYSKNSSNHKKMEQNNDDSVIQKHKIADLTDFFPDIHQKPLEKSISNIEGKNDYHQSNLDLNFNSFDVDYFNHDPDFNDFF